MKYRINTVTIKPGLYYQLVEFSGDDYLRTYHKPTDTSWNRLLRYLRTGYLDVFIYSYGRGLQIIATRKDALDE